jgi:hypothetical protein
MRMIEKIGLGGSTKKMKKKTIAPTLPLYILFNLEQTPMPRGRDPSA